MWKEILMWTAVALAALFVLYFMTAMITSAIVLAVLYGREEHRYSRYALFSDFPKIAVRKIKVPFGKRGVLAGYLLGAENIRSKKGLVVVSHGIRDRGEGYFTEARAFLERGYAVLLYDAVGSGSSSGRSQRGLPQSPIDLHRILLWAESEPSLKGVPFYLYGHSWGGYAVCSVFCLGEHGRVRAVASLSGFNKPSQMLVEGASTSSELFGKLIAPPLRLTQFLRFGRGVYRTAEKGIAKAGSARFLILHAGEDEAVKIDGAGIYALREELESPRVRFLKIEGRTHLNAWLSEACCARNAVYDERYRKLAGKYGFKLTKKQECEFYASVDREVRVSLSEADGEFFDRIDAFFTKEEGKECRNTI